MVGAEHVPEPHALLKYSDENHSKFEVKCTSGTYVRSLAQDLSLKLGALGHALNIKRLGDAFFNIKDSILAEDQIWFWKEILTLICLVCGFVLIIPISKILTGLPFFQSLGNRLFQSTHS